MHPINRKMVQVALSNPDGVNPKSEGGECLYTQGDRHCYAGQFFVNYSDADQETVLAALDANEGHPAHTVARDLGYDPNNNELFNLWQKIADGRAYTWIDGEGEEHELPLNYIDGAIEPRRWADVAVIVLEILDDIELL